MEDESSARTPLELKRGQRVTLGLLGAALLAAPVLSYLDRRLGVLGEPAAAFLGFDWTVVACAVIGAVLAVSATVGRLLIWKEIASLDANLPAGEEAIADVAMTGEATSAVPDASKVPFQGEYTKVEPENVDAAFRIAAQEYMRDRFGGGRSHGGEIIASFSTGPTRKSWVFCVQREDGSRRWIRVPHAGRGGSGAAPSARISEI